ncbi:hypothetical protein DSM106972_093910 [Dulcicalothrix desertica PCC 7102]|uniref:DUF1822 domain-containing protein n=1 Tax=Dulcicalothrix desertica PCC 7102 TaxID=232991 RepID=A0A433UK61_9CYAN|nr:DUF1822 family protein [Dulcicalothrix desertica]RUS94194.1 hypothetical protein DSM106972_093910 [Dulcicalothrix desertica PCC 7102]TWH53349.1 uncharacterized protein DUF1822 [Dulcicalothrix desertica PCC 7102]
MTFNSLPTIDNPTHLWLEIPEAELERSWQHQPFSTPNRRWIAYLNRVSLSAFLPWLHSEHDSNAQAYPKDAALPSIWEAVNGTAISFGNKKMVLIPTEALDIDEFRVPQEWVDIPNWVADYYLAVQVNLEEGFIRVWGYTTHVQLKNEASYDAFDKAYCLDSEDLISNLNILWLSQQLCPDVTRAAVAPLPKLSLFQAQNLIQRLGNPNVIIPRTQIPFATWGALLQHGGWRQRLYEQRQGIQQWSVNEWLQNGVSDFALLFGWATVDTAMAGARGSNVIETSPSIVRRLTINSQQCELQVRPQGNITSRIWRFELRALPGELLPTSFKLRLLTEDLQPFEGNEVEVRTSVESVYLEVALGELPEGLVWEIEPTPDNFELEILYI